DCVGMGCGASVGLREDLGGSLSSGAERSEAVHPGLGTALGKGSYGCVFLAKALYSQASYAVKVQTSRRTAAQKIQHEASQALGFKESDPRPGQSQGLGSDGEKVAGCGIFGTQASSNAEIWKLCATHRNVVHFVQMCQEADIYYMVMEACDCSLFDRLIDNPKWHWDQLTGDLFQLVAGLQHLHTHRVLHSDIKAENALYGGSDGRTLKLADFGLAVYITPNDGPLTRARGSRSYMAPEMLAGEGYGFTADAWNAKGERLQKKRREEDGEAVTRMMLMLVYVILVGQFPIGQSKQTKSELTRQIIKVETEPVRLMNLAGKLKRSIAAEQGRLEMRRRLQGQSSNTGSSSDFHKIAPSSEEPLTNPLTGSQSAQAAQDETLARHLAVQVKRLKVVEFMRTLLRRNPEVRCSASEALQAEIFIQQQSQEVLDDDEGDLLVVNRRPLKRQKDGEKEGDKEADKEGDKGAADLQQNASEGSPVNQQRKSDKTSRDLSYQPDSPRHSKPEPGSPPASQSARKEKEEPEPEHQDEENSLSLPGGDPKVRIPPQRKRSVTALGNEDSSGPGRLLQVPSQKKLNKAKTTGQLDSSANGAAEEADANGIGSPRTSGLQLESPRALTPTSITALQAPGRAGGSPTPMSPSNNGQPYPGDSDLFSGEPRGEQSMSRVNSRLSSVGAKSIKSSMGVSMFSRDQSGFDLLHQLAGKSDAVASSFQFQDSGILDSSSPTRPRPASQRLNHMGSGHSVRSGNSFRSGASEMVLGPVGEGEQGEQGERSPEHSEAALPSALPSPEPRQPRPLPPPPEVPINVEPRIPEEEGPTPSKLQRRVSASCLADADRPKPMLKRRVSFDEVLYMQHMVPVVPNQIPSPTPGSNASNGSNSSEEAGG
ncbi:Dclk1, partial [Symbiodinium sp. KB8]